MIILKFLFNFKETKNKNAMTTKLTICLVLLFFIRTFAQVGINTDNPNPSSALDVVSETKGFLMPRVLLTSTSQQLVSSNTNATSLLVYNIGSPAMPKGYYSWGGTQWLQLIDESKIIKALPKFFYMPSVLLPTISTDPLIGTGPSANYTYDTTSQTYAVNIYSWSLASWLYD